jgi:hypothetical protein
VINNHLKSSDASTDERSFDARSLMPFVVTSPRLCEAFPGNCPYCGIGSATERVAQAYSKMGLSAISGHVKSETWNVALPACRGCARWFRSQGLLTYAVGVFALLSPLAIFAFEPKWIEWAWIAAMLAWAALPLWRRYRAGAFRIAYIGDGEIVYSARSEAYATEFARQNGLSAVKKPFVMKLA